MLRPHSSGRLAQMCGFLMSVSWLPFALNADESLEYAGEWQGSSLLCFMKPSGLHIGGCEVVEGAVDIKPDGTFNGRFPAAGCTVSGSSTNYAGPANAALGVRLAKCFDARFDGRYGNTPRKSAAAVRLLKALVVGQAGNGRSHRFGHSAPATRRGGTRERPIYVALKSEAAPVDGPRAATSLLFDQGRGSPARLRWRRQRRSVIRTTCGAESMDSADGSTAPQRFRASSTP